MNASAVLRGKEAVSLLFTSRMFMALLLSGTIFNNFFFMGLIMVIGIVAKNGILSLDSNQNFRGEGRSAEQATVRAGERCLRLIPISELAPAPSPV